MTIEDVMEILREDPPEPGERGSIRGLEDDAWYDYSRSGQLIHITCYKRDEVVIFELKENPNV